MTIPPFVIYIYIFFFATSHGKGACDEVGSSVKRSAYRTSLQRPHNDPITTPENFYTWAKGFFKKVSFDFCTQQDYERAEKTLESQYFKSITIQNTRQYHSFQPSETGKHIFCKKISSLSTYKVCNILK